MKIKEILEGISLPRRGELTPSAKHLRTRIRAKKKAKKIIDKDNKNV